MNTLKYIITGVLLVFLATPTLCAEQFTILTGNYPPYQYEKEGEIKGVSAAIVRAILKRVNHPDHIELRSWNAAYNLIQMRPGHVLFSMTHLPEREKLFKWVGPLTINPHYFFKKKDSPVQIQNFEDAQNVSSIGVSKNSADHIFLASQGFHNLKVSGSSLGHYKILALNRVDLAPANSISLPFTAKFLEFDPTDFKNTGVKLFDSHYYIAFSKDTPDEIIARWQQALDEIKDSALYEKLYNEALQEAYKDFNMYERKLTIALFNPAQKGDPFWDQVEVFTRAVARDLDIQLGIYRANHNRYTFMNRIRAVLQGPDKPDAILYQPEPYHGTEILRLAERFQVPVLLFNTKTENYGNPRERFVYWIGEILPDQQKNADEHIMQGGWALILLHDYLHGFDFVTESVSFRCKMDKGLQERDVDEWDQVDFKRFSKKYNPYLSHYDFSLEALAPQPGQSGLKTARTEDVIQIVTGEWAPFVSIKMPDYGVFAEIITAAFKEMEIEPIYTFDNWLNGYSQVQLGTQVATFPYIKTPNREKDMYFSDGVLPAKVVLFYNKTFRKEPIIYTDLEDLKQYDIAGTPGYFYEELFDEASVKYYKFTSDALSFKELYKGHIDLFPMDEIVGWSLLKDLYPNDYQTIFATVEKPLLEAPYHVIFSKKHPDGLKMGDMFNKGLKRIQEKGVYQEILLRYGMEPNLRLFQE